MEGSGKGECERSKKEKNRFEIIENKREWEGGRVGAN